jgi:zinc transport system permease protein
LGVALAFYAQIHLGVSAALASPTLGAIAATSVAVLALMLDRRAQATQRDSLLGAIFLLGSAGTILLGTRIVQEVQDIQALLFGTAVAVLPEHLRLLVVVAVALGALHLWWWRGFVSVSLDPEGSQVRRLPARALEVTLLLGLGLAISTSTRVLGALPTFAFSVLPALMATRIAPNLPRALWLAALLGAACGFGGYVLAFLYELPVGAAQAALGVAGFAAVGLARRAIFFRGR